MEMLKIKSVAKQYFSTGKLFAFFLTHEGYLFTH